MDEKNMKDIKALVKVFNESNLSEMEVSLDDFMLKLGKDCTVSHIPQSKSILTSCAEKTEVGAQDTVKILRPQVSDAVDFNRLKEIKSPMIGVFYAAPAESAEPYVRVGSKVKRGDILCIIEAMKMMNEITAETDGEIVDIVGKNGEVVEFGQVIFKVF